VHLTLGILARFQAVFYALAFFWLDGFAVPAPAQVTQAVGHTGEKMVASFFRMRFAMEYAFALILYGNCCMIIR
jgi:hypothetical protein